MGTFLREVLPFLPALLHQLQNRLEIAWAMNVVFMHVLPWSRPTVFVEGNFLVANQARNVLPLFSSSSSSRRWRGALHEEVILIVQIQGPNPPCQSLGRFSLGPRLLLLLDLHGRFPSPILGLVCCSFLPGVKTPPPPDSLPPSLPDSSSSTRKSSLTSILFCRSCYRYVCSRQQQIAQAVANGRRVFLAAQ